MRIPYLCSAIVCFLSAVFAAPSKTADADWPGYGGGPDEIRYSTLSQINRSNVSKLQLAWSFDTGDAFRGSEFQCNPLIVKGILYAVTPKGNVVALDAATGKQTWRFDPGQATRVIGTVRDRGLTYWSHGTSARVFTSYRQYLYSLDAATGKPDLSFGDNGRIDLRDQLGREPQNMVSLTTPGFAYKDLLIIGSMMSETLPASPGDIRAYDVHSGKMRWIFHTIPHPGEFGYETWPKDAWTYSGAANDWSGLAIDVQRGLVFVPTGSAAFDFYGANRVGDDLFANCVIALDANTGKRVWHFQEVHHDIWDRDFPSPPSLITVQRNGKTIDAVAQTSKWGQIYVFDRETGKSLFPIEERPVPGSDLPGEVTAKTQPFPQKPEPFARQVLTEDMLTARTPAAHDAALARFKRIRSGGQFVPGSTEGTIVFPGFDGGAEWGGSAYDPETGILYVNSNEMAWILRMVKQQDTASGPGAGTSGKDLYVKNCASCHRSDMSGGLPEFPSLKGLKNKYSDSEVMELLFQGSGRMPSFAHLGAPAVKAIANYVMNGEDVKVQSQDQSAHSFMKYMNDGYNRFLDPDGYPAIQPPWGTLNAINLSTGQYAWKIPFGAYPDLVAKGMSDTGSENYGGPVVTAGGLLFIGATSYDKKFHAYDKATGKLLWETILPFAGNATPATYEVDGRQYVVIAAGGGKSKDASGGQIIAFALPRQN